MKIGVILVAASLAGPRALGQPVVELRGGQRVTAQSVEPGPSGLAVTTADGRTLLAWHLVRSVNGAGAEASEPYLSAAEDAWRGLTRLERGDTIAAEPLLESAFAAMRMSPGASRAAVAEGLLRCRLARGSQASAVVPWLTLMVDEAEGHWAPGASTGFLDTGSGLVTILPPIWPGEVGLSAVARELSDGSFETWPTGRVRDLAILYAASALTEAGAPAPPHDPQSTDQGVALVRDIVNASSADERVRSASRRELLTRLGSSPPAWQAAWCHAGIAQSLGLEDEPSQRLSVVHWLVVPALFTEDQPFLAGICTARAAEQLLRLGRDEQAQALARELQTDEPEHPSLARPAIQRLLRAGTQPAAPDPEARS